MSIKQQEQLRSEFPFFREHPEWIFLENAGGSQVPLSVINSISNYYSRTYVQVGAEYDQSSEATQTVKLAHDFCRELVNGNGIGEVVLGASTTQLIHTLSHAFDKLITSPDDEIIVSNTAHEANYGAWTKLQGKIIEWQAHKGINYEEFSALLSERTRIVALPHVSNLIGEILDVETIVQLVRSRSPRARVIVDGVAYAPHRAIDVRQWNVDFYVFSLYKVYGPHLSVLYGSNSAWQDFIDISAGPNHFFIPQSNVSYQYEIGCLNHEACAGILGIKVYFERVAKASPDQPVRETIEQAYRIFANLEQPLVERLFQYLSTKSDVTILGSATTNFRCPTISFRSSRLSSSEIVKHLHAHKIACRNGHMYGYRLIAALGLDLDDAVVRLSAVHYNTVAEIERCIEVLEEIL
ncbi:unnamed protein product [Adineta ricciae]|uniref:Aminotransferase class V domain-containing protein n=1 Tax=Adineta ricciae TaxID=249248 RepID=A0A814AHX6_ADIRI|nr:unnamed protein product [Adineta ricciae]CAF1116729.1 unnamed protein product [Adineta ricciae]